MIDNFYLAINDYDKNIDFYIKAFELLGYNIINQYDVQNWKSTLFGDKSKDIEYDCRICIGSTKNNIIVSIEKFHIVLKAHSIEEINLWHEKCLEFGATNIIHNGIDFGTPQYKTHYHEGFYCAGIIAPDGTLLEAAFHDKTKV
jgi:hypothetical protein